MPHTIHKSVYRAVVLSALATIGSRNAIADPVALPAPNGESVKGQGDAVSSWLQRNADPEKTNFLPRRDASPSRVTRGQPSGRVETGVRTMDLLWPLLIVLALIIGGAMVLRRWTPVAQRMPLRGGIQILGRQYLSGKQSVCLIRLGRRVICLGVTPESISTLAQIEDPDEIASLVAGVQSAAPQSFTSIFTRMATQPAPMAEDRADESVIPTTPTRTRAASQLHGLLARVQKWSDAKASAEPVKMETVTTA